MRSDKKSPLKSDKKVPPKVQKKGSLGYNKKSALLEDAITQMNAGKYGRASSALKDLLALDPLNAEARRLFATLHLRLGSLMSARTAFESLAREAMERQDYWLAESLLREYLMAGPRYVPFLEMLGRVYEEKGDVMAAVAEYGKAVEVLLEDPDSDKPNHPSELFARIRSIAPGSPVSFRLAAMFDAVTGQVLQATPQPAVHAQENESSQAAAVEAPPDGAAPMPWEQTEPLQADVAATYGPSESLEAPPTEVIEPIIPSALPADAVAAVDPWKPEIDHSPIPETADLPTTRIPDRAGSSVPPVGPNEAMAEAAVEHEPSDIDALPALSSEAELTPPMVSPESLPGNVALVEADVDPVAHAPSSPAPMPWDQVEELAVVIPPAPASQEATVSGQVTKVSPEPEAGPRPDAEAVLPSMEVLTETGSHPIAPMPSSPVPMPWDQVAEEVAAIPPPASQMSAVQVSSEPPPSEAELPPAPANDPVPRAIEVLSQSGSHPIVATPTTPVSMPWDQVEENPIPIPPPAAPSSLIVAENTPASHEEKPVPAALEDASSGVEIPAPQAEAPTASPFASNPSEITSSGLSWDEILAAVAAMQSSPAPAQSLPSAESTQVPGPTVTAEPVPAIEAALDAAEVPATSPNAPSPEFSLDPGSGSSRFSAPMPWEQIEVEDVFIPPQEAEPEFGSASCTVEAAGESDRVTQDSTLVLPAVPETPELLVQGESPTAAAEPSPEDANGSADDFRLSTDDHKEPHSEWLHHEAEFHEAIRAEQSTTPPEAEPSVGLTKEESAAIPLRLVEQESTSQRAAVEPDSVRTEPIREFTLAGTRAESVAVEASEAAPQVEPSLLAEPEMMTSSAPAAVDEMIVAPISLSSVQDQAGSVVEPIAHRAQAEAPAGIPALERGPTQSLPEEPVAKSAEYGLVDAPATVGEVSPVESTEGQIDPGEKFLPVAPPESSTEVPADEPGILLHIPQAPEPAETEPLIKMAAEPAVAVSEVTAPAAPTSAEAPVGDGLHILWEDASPAPTPKRSAGNMLTRWLKKTAEPVAPEGNTAPPATPVPVELVAPVTSQAVEEQAVEVVMPAAVVKEQLCEQVETVPPAIGEELLHRPRHIQPAGVGVWSRVGVAAAALVGAGVSTTRSLVVLILALVGLVLFAVGGTIAAVALTWVMLEEQPNAAYRTMTSVPQPTLQDSSKNGYFLLLGFGAAANQDPVQVGMDRRVEGADRAYAHTCLTGEGYSPEGGSSAGADRAGKWMKAADPALQMQTDAAGAKTWLSQAEVSLSRYRQWLNKPFEDAVGYGQSISPNCGLILETHRLYLAEGFVQDMDTGMGRLETDLTAWRTVLGQAKSLPVKMLASAAINDDVTIMGGLLQRPDLDERYVSRMAKLARPLEPSEQSLRWPMQSQFVLATKTLEEAVIQNRADTRPFYGAIAAALPLPKQRRFNAYADYYETAGKAAAEGRYADLPKLSRFVRVAPYTVSDMVVNPIESLVGVDPLPAWETYAGRVLETDARLRLVSLQAWLRRTAPEQDLLTRLAKAGQGLYDPFTGLPMLVNMKKGVLYSVGPDLKDNEAHERLDLVAQIPTVAWTGKKPADWGKSK